MRRAQKIGRHGIELPTRRLMPREARAVAPTPGRARGPSAGSARVRRPIRLPISHSPRMLGWLGARRAGSAAAPSHSAERASRRARAAPELRGPELNLADAGLPVAPPRRRAPPDRSGLRSPWAPPASSATSNPMGRWASRPIISRRSPTLPGFSNRSRRAFVSLVIVVGLSSGVARLGDPTPPTITALPARGAPQASDLPRHHPGATDSRALHRESPACRRPRNRSASCTFAFAAGGIRTR